MGRASPVSLKGEGAALLGDNDGDVDGIAVVTVVNNNGYWVQTVDTTVGMGVNHRRGCDAPARVGLCELLMHFKTCHSQR